MAAVIGSLRAELSATIAKFQEDMKNAGAAVREFATKAEAQGKRLQRVGAQLSVALTAPLVAFGVKAVKAATESAQALGQLDAALKSTEHQAGRTLKQLQAQAKALESISTFDDDDILKDVTTNLTKFGNVVGEVFDKAQLAIVNMASRTGDLSGATQIWGRALQDPVRGITLLRKAGVDLGDEQEKLVKKLVATGRGVEAQNILLEEAERIYGGAAKALRDATPSAAMAQQWRELQEIVGKIVLDVLPPLLNFLTDIAKAFNSLSPEMQRFAVYTALGAAALGPLTTLVGTLIRVAVRLTPILIGLRTVMLGLSAVTWGWIAAIGAVVAALVIFWNSVKKILTGDFTGAWEEAKKTALGMWRGMQDMFTGKPLEIPVKVAEPTGEGIKPGKTKFNQPQDAVNARKTFETDIRQMGDKISSAFRKAELPKSVAAAADLNAQIDEMITKAKLAGVNTAAWSKEIQVLRDRIEGLKAVGLDKETKEFGRDVAANALAVRRFASGSLDPLNEELATVDQAYEQLRLKIEAQIEDNAELAKVSDSAAAAMERLEQSLSDLEKAHAAAREAAVAQYRAEQDLANAQAFGELTQTQRDIEDLKRARGDLGHGRSTAAERIEATRRDLQDRLIATQERLAELELARTQAELTNDLDALERINQQIAVQTQLRDLIAETSAEQIDHARRIEDAFDEAFDGIENEIMKMAKQGKFSIAELREFIRDALFDAFVKPHIEKAGGIFRDLATGALKALGGSLFGGGGSATFDPGSGNWTPGPEGFPEMATGGYVPPGEWAIAGETGEAELVFGGKRGAQVFSPQDSRGMLGGGNTTVIQNIRTQDTYSFQRTARQVARTTKRALQEA